MSPLEISLVDKVMRLLTDRGCRVIKTHGSTLRQGEPDLYCCWPDGTIGWYVVIEMKQPGKKPRPLQYLKLRRWAKSGAIAFWSSDPDEIVSIIEREITARKNGTTTLCDGRPI